LNTARWSTAPCTLQGRRHGRAFPLRGPGLRVQPARRREAGRTHAGPRARRRAHLLRGHDHLGAEPGRVAQRRGHAAGHALQRQRHHRAAAPEHVAACARVRAGSARGATGGTPRCFDCTYILAQLTWRALRRSSAGSARHARRVQRPTYNMRLHPSRLAPARLHDRAGRTGELP